jgi:RNA-directed DNA polymerase
MGNPSGIDTSLTNIWQSWWNFRVGKRSSQAILAFEWQLERNLTSLQRDINDKNYVHGSYDHFIVNDAKRRDIAVANVRDRVVHRILYDYLVKVCDSRFDYDVWSCRLGKGNFAAIERVSGMLRKYPDAFVWRGDVQKFFDNVDQSVLSQLLDRYDLGEKARYLLDEVICSYPLRSEAQSIFYPTGGVLGIPIGNLTSQILANVYLHEFDYFVRHELKPLCYTRYGDDFLLFATSHEAAVQFQRRSKAFLQNKLHLKLHPRNNLVISVRRGVRYLGVVLYPNSKTLSPRSFKVIESKQNLKNYTSYVVYVNQYGNARQRSQAQLWIVKKRVV